jgi:hypothetical protein
MKGPAIVLLLVGCSWAILTVWLFLAISAISEPASVGAVIFYYGGMLLGPAALISGSCLLLRGMSLRLGVTLTVLGCVILTGFVLYQSMVGLRPKPLEMKPSYILYAVLLTVMLVSDLAAYKIYRLVVSHFR